MFFYYLKISEKNIKKNELKLILKDIKKNINIIINKSPNKNKYKIEYYLIFYIYKYNNNYYSNFIINNLRIMKTIIDKDFISSLILYKFEDNKEKYKNIIKKFRNKPIINILKLSKPKRIKIEKELLKKINNKNLIISFNDKDFQSQLYIIKGN